MRETPEIFISYSRKDGRNLADKLDAFFQKKGIIIKRDDREIGYKDSIQEYMQRLGQGRYVLVVISDEYFKSPPCMDELQQLKQHKDFSERIFPITVGGTNIYEAEASGPYIRYWEDKYQSLQNDIKSGDLLNSKSIIDNDLKKYRENSRNIGPLIAFLRDINTYPLRNDNFGSLYEALQKQLDKDFPGWESFVQPRVNTFQKLREFIRKELRKIPSDKELSYYVINTGILQAKEAMPEQEDAINKICTEFKEQVDKLNKLPRMDPQYDQDCFISAYLKKCLELDCQWFEELPKARRTAHQGKLFPELRNHLLPEKIRQKLGEFTQESHRAPCISEGKYKKGSIPKTVLDQALKDLRGSEITYNDYRLFNLVEILKKTRKDLSDTDLSYLDLRYIDLNNIRLGYGFRQGAEVVKSKLSPQTLFPQKHTGWINDVRYSPDGMKFLSAGDDGLIKEWNCVNRVCIITYRGLSGKATAIDYAPDGKTIVAGSSDGTLREWQVGHSEPLTRSYTGHISDITAVRYSPDGTRLLSASQDGIITEWDTEDKSCLYTYTEHFDKVTSLAYNHDGTKFVSGSYDGTAKVWKSGDEWSINYDHPENASITSVNFSPDGTKIIAGDVNGYITEWQIFSKKRCIPYHAHDDAISSLSYTPDGKRIVSCSASRAGKTDYFDPTIKEWDVERKKCLAVYKGHQHGVNALDYNGRKILSASYDYTMKEWSVDSHCCIRTYNTVPSSAIDSVIMLDNDKLLCGGRHGIITLWNVHTKKCLKTYLGNVRGQMSLRISNDRQRIQAVSTEGCFLCWDLASGESLAHHQKEGEKFFCISPDGEKTLSVSHEGILKVWEVTTGESLKEYHNVKFNDRDQVFLAYNPTGDTILAASENIVEVRDGSTGEKLHKEPHCLERFTITDKTYKTLVDKFAKDDHLKRTLPFLKPLIGIQLLRDEFDCRLTHFLFSSAEIAQIFDKEATREDSYKIPFVCYDPRGRKILAVSGKTSNEGTEITGKELEEWDVESGKHLRTYRHDYDMTRCGYSPDEKRIIAASRDLPVEWDAETGERLESFDQSQKHTRPIMAISYNADVTRVVSGSQDGTLKVWDTTTRQCLQTITNIFGLLIQGVDMTDVSWDPPLADKEKALLRSYGAIIPR